MSDVGIEQCKLGLRTIPEVADSVLGARVVGCMQELGGSLLSAIPEIGLRELTDTLTGANYRIEQNGRRLDVWGPSFNAQVNRGKSKIDNVLVVPEAGLTTRRIAAAVATCLIRGCNTNDCIRRDPTDPAEEVQDDHEQSDSPQETNPFRLRNCATCPLGCTGYYEPAEVVTGVDAYHKINAATGFTIGEIIADPDAYLSIVTEILAVDEETAGRVIACLSKIDGSQTLSMFNQDPAGCDDYYVPKVVRHFWGPDDIGKIWQKE